MYPNVFAHFYISDIVLIIDSNAVYLAMPQAKSRIADYFQLSDHLTKTNNSTLNGAIIVYCRAIKHVVSLSVEAETVEVFRNA